jgi:agmatinase
MPQQSAAEYLSHGQTPFFRLTVAANGELDRGTRAAIVGVPHDAGTTYQPGARFAPYHIRRVSALVQGFHPTHRLDVFEKVSVVDGGNVVFPPFDRAAMRGSVEERSSALLERGVTPFLVGGDHSIALPALRAAHRHFGPLAVIHVDAHFDTSGPEIWGDEFHHGTPLRHALAKGIVERGQLHQVGLRGPWGHAGEGAFGADLGACVHTADDVALRGAGAIAAEIRASVSNRPVYLTVDVDAVDPAFAPGTGTPVPGGLTSREVLQLLRSLAGVNLVAMDLVEVCPSLDHGDITSHLAAHLLYEGIALLAVPRPASECRSPALPVANPDDII